MTPRHVFLSFASEDVAVADALLASLEAAGIRCWIAHRDIPPAASYPAAIGAAIGSSGVVLLVLTEFANRSPHVRREVEMAFNAATPILPVRLRGALPSEDLQYFLSHSQWLDAGGSLDAQEAARLETAVRTLLERGGAPAEVLGRPRRWRMLVVATAVLLMTVTGVVLWRTTRETSPVAEGAGSPAGPASEFRAPSTPTPIPAPDAAPVELEGRAIPGERPSPESVGGASVKVHPRDGQAYVWVPPGRFVMGCSPGDGVCEDDERPAHPVAIARGFWLGRTEVTVEQYARGRGEPAPASDVARLPVTGVTWADAKSYCTAMGGRLPSEAEWEYAARARELDRYYAAPADVAWYEGNSDERVHPVAARAPNAFGLYDMLGHVAEWVADRYYNAYDDSGEATGVEEPLAPNAFAVTRGGSFISAAAGVRVSRRAEALPDGAEPFIGLRCVQDRL